MGRATVLRPVKFVTRSVSIVDDVATITLPLRLVKPSNLREHWTARRKRAEEHRTAACQEVRNAGRSLSWWAQREETGVLVTITRLGPRKLDDHDAGPAASCKYVVDGVADAIAFGQEITKLVNGVRAGTGRYSDDDVRIVWCFGQEWPSPYGVRVEIGRGERNG